MPDDSWETFKNLSIKTLVIEEGVTSIAKSAFYYHPEIKGNLVIPSTVKSIGDFAFYECSGLTGDLIIPEGVTHISDYAFRGCEGFDGELKLPKKISEIGLATFSLCGHFKGDLVIPDSVTRIADDAFRSAGFDGRLKLDTELTDIGDMAFSYSGLSGHIEFTDGLYSIGDSCFRSCTNITGITLPETLLNIKDYAFANCEELSGDLVIPDSVACVGKNSFNNCKKLSSVAFGSGISSIGPGAFEGCASLKTASISDYMPDYYSKDEDMSSFDDNTELIGFDESKKGSTLWNDYKETKLSESSKTEDIDSDADGKMEPYYWTDSLTRETFKGTGSYADTTLYFMDGMITVSINGRDYNKVPYKADPDTEEKLIKVDNFVYLYGNLSDLEFFDNGYMKGVIKATLSWDDGIGEYLEIKRTLDVSDKDYGIDYTEICIVNGYIKNENVWIIQNTSNCYKTEFVIRSLKY